MSAGRSRTIALVALLVVFPVWAGALVLDSDDAGGGTSKPDDDPGFANVLRRLGGPSVVYLGDRWVLTANHVGAGVVQIGQKLYDPIPSSIRRIQNDDGSLTDLLLFQINADLDLPRLELATSSPRLAEDVVLVGFGASRGTPVSMAGPEGGLRDGFQWNFDDTKRWGTNVIADVPRFVRMDATKTRAIPTVFDRMEDPRGTPHEAQAAFGDSGGALFARADRLDPDSTWVLAGILFTVSGIPEQPTGTSFYGDVTYAADIAHYREQILQVVRPACVSGDFVDRDDALACGSDASRSIGAMRRPPDWSLALAFGLVLLLAGYAIRRHGA